MKRNAITRHARSANTHGWSATELIEKYRSGRNAPGTAPIPAVAASRTDTVAFPRIILTAGVAL